MSIKKCPIPWFIAELKAALARKDGYIMASTGQNPKKWAPDSWWFTQYSGSQKTKALYWRDHAQRVWDCNGMAEGLYKDYTGVDINTTAKHNWKEWCASENGWGTIPEDKRAVGMAVFKANSKGAYTSIHHVGYLVEPVNPAKPTGDWYIIEAKGVMYGVIRSKLSDGGWNAWGKMDKYFDYGMTTVKTETEDRVGVIKVNDYPVISFGTNGEYVVLLQKALLAFDADSLPKYGADGDFGNETRTALKRFQSKQGLTVDGIAGAETWAALKKYIDGEKSITVTGNTVNLRSGAGTSYAIIGVAKKGQNILFNETQKVGETIWYKTGFGWISGKYATEV